MRSGNEAAPRPLTLASFRASAGLIGSLILGGGVVTWIFITDGVRDIAFRLSGELQPLYLEQIAGLTLAQIGLLGSVFSGAMMLTPMLSGRMADRYGERVPISAGFLIVFAALVVFLYASAYLVFIASWALFGIGVGLLSPAYQLFYSGLGLISLPAPWLGAQLWEHFNPRLPFLITAGVALVTLLPAWLKFRLPKAETTSQFHDEIGHGAVE